MAISGKCPEQSWIPGAEHGGTGSLLGLLLARGRSRSGYGIPSKWTHVLLSPELPSSWYLEFIYVAYGLEMKK